MKRKHILQAFLKNAEPFAPPDLSLLKYRGNDPWFGCVSTISWRRNAWKRQQKFHCFRDAAEKFSPYLLMTVTKGPDEHERITKEDQGFSARETETEVITLQREHLCNWRAEAKWNDQKKKRRGRFRRFGGMRTTTTECLMTSSS